MNNNWEYDYSELYQNNNQTAQRSTYEPQEQYAVPVKKKGGWLGRVIASVLLVACCFGAGYGGFYLAFQDAMFPTRAAPHSTFPPRPARPSRAAPAPLPPPPPPPPAR